MGQSITYRLVDKDLVINEQLNWTWDRNKNDQIREWKLINVDTNDLDKKLKLLTDYGYGADFELSPDSNELRIYLDFTDEEIIINSEKATFTLRDYNFDELKDIIDNLHRHLENEENTVRLNKKKFDSLEKLVNDELDRKTKILEGTKDENPAHVKALASVDILNKIRRNLLSEE
ncbi:MAG: hypothetical protein KF763_21170 [Cyclobacteriaceae bacterium]|nr:hypothetical protein [Cyclobacteriaceae bacterium]